MSAPGKETTLDQLPKPARKKRWQRRFAYLDALPHDPDTGRLAGFVSIRGFGWSKFRERYLCYSSLGFLFSFIYYLHLGMRHKAGLILAADLFLFGLFVIFGDFTGLHLGGLASTGISVLCGQFVIRDYYKHVRYGDRFWVGLPRWLQPGWVQSTRGVWMALGGAFLFAMVTLAVPDLSTSGDTAFYADASKVWSLKNKPLALDLADEDKTLTYGDLALYCKPVTVTRYRAVLTCNNPQAHWDVVLNKIPQGKNHYILSINVNNGGDINMGYLRDLPAAGAQ